VDAHTLELLEFNKVRELLSGYAASSLGKDLARQIEPMTDLARIHAELSLVTEMTEALGQNRPPPLAGLYDVRLLVRRAAIGAMLTAEQLLEVAGTMTCTGNLYRYRTSLPEKFQQLISFLTPIEDLGVVSKAIAGCIDGRGHVLDMASRELTQVRQQLTDLEERVQSQIRRLLREPRLRDILRYPNATVSGDHYVLPVAANHRHKLPGVVHRTSATGETVFIEPAEVAGLSAERTVLKGEEDREIRRILRRLSSEVGKVARPLTFAIDLMARLDLITAKARFSRDYNMYGPDLNTEGRLWLRQARHPVLEHLFRQKAEIAQRVPMDMGASARRGSPDPAASSTDGLPSTTHLSPLTTRSSPPTVVPIDVRLGMGYNLLVITGPNTGGKTVTLKTTGLLCLMAQSGMHIPAGQGSAVPVFEQVLADIGDEQSLEQSLSTFSSHMSRIASILNTANAQSLVLLDELGAGTDPTEGAALGRAILDELDRLGCRAMVTTHLGDLKTYAFHNKNAENAAVEFDVQTLRPTYRLHIGQYGMSNAIKIARRLKLPRELLRRAHRYLRRRQRRAPEMAQLQQVREQAEKAREEALAAQHRAEQERVKLAEQHETLQKQAAREAALRAFRANLKPNDPVSVPRFDKPGRVVRLDHKRGVVLVSVGIGQWEVALDDIMPVES
jgi:DNA mismatch repair protein MutS2